ncbi:MAG: phage tail assembly protein [Spirochaetota bacterium]|jgi:hypothetical protein|nr:phage tail assembly protein [Spirochaetota bacterium]
MKTPWMSKKEEQAASEELAADGGFAEQEFYNWCDANDIDRSTEGMNEDEARSFEKIKKAFTKAITEKRLIVDGSSFMYTISDRSPGAGNTLTVRTPTGRAWTALGEAKSGNDVQRIQFFIASICGVEKKDIAQITGLVMKDYKVLLGAATLFLTE